MSTKSATKFVYSLFVVVLLPPRLALGQTNNVVDSTETMFHEGVDLMGKKNYAAACPLLEKVAQLVPTGIGARKALGDCYVGLGRKGSAWEAYMEGHVLATKANDERAAEFWEAAQTLSNESPTITLVVPKEGNDLSGTTITCAGRPRDVAQWNVPIPTDVGEYEVRVITPNGRSWTQQVQVKSSRDQLKVAIPVTLFIVPTKPAVTSRSSWQTGLGWASIGIGAASLATSGILSGLAVMKRDASNADGHCGAENRCDATGFILRNEAISMGNGATAAFTVGSVLLGTGIGVLITRSKDDTPKDGTKSSAVSWRFDAAPGGIGLTGIW